MENRMILDLKRFVEAERPRWQRLEAQLQRLEADPAAGLTLEEAQEFHALYQRACASLAKVSPLVSEPELKRYLEWLVGRAYCEIHEVRERRAFSIRRWFFLSFPQAFRRRIREFGLATALTLLGCGFGALALGLDPDVKPTLLPYSHLQTSPKQRVAEEAADRGRRLTGAKGRFSASLMTHNTQVALTTLALGMTFGLGTMLVLFYNGVVLGAVAFDYSTGGETAFLLGWLLPHGAVEIPSILLAGQAGLLLGYALIGWGSREPRLARLRAILPDLVTLACGAALLLVWAGIVEAFFSQYHEPVVPYAAKIAFGVLELILLFSFLLRSGRREQAA